MEYNMIKGTFTSIWSEGSVTTPCFLNLQTGGLFPESADGSDRGTLESEEFTASNGDTYKVCPVCHEYILKGKMIPDQTGKGMHEEDQCTNPNCESNEECMPNWYEELGKAVAAECNLTKGSPIEHQLGTVWVEDKAISGTVIESDENGEG
jgi:hypothetical protein